jgi:peptidoglycan hydrolase FlgJ
MDVTHPGAVMPGATTLSATMLGATTSGVATLGATTGGTATANSATSGAMAPPASADPDAQLDPKVWQAAQKFEAMAIGQMLAPMFDTVDLSKSKFGGGQGEAAWKPMMIDAIGKQMEQQGGFGLAQPIYAAMLRAQEGRAQQTPAQAGRTQPGHTQTGEASAQPSQLHATHPPGKTP